MEGKLLYQYPPTLTRSQKQAQALNELSRHRKMRSQMYRNFILAGVILGLSFLVRVAFVKVLLIVIGLLNGAVGAVIYGLYAASQDKRLYTRIYSDHLEHCQRSGLKKQWLHYRLFYSEVKRSFQDNRGAMIFELEKPELSSCEREEKSGERVPVALEDPIKLRFADTSVKLALIEKVHEQIGYPKKNYNVITDDDDYYSPEDLQWDRLHKHGL